MAMLVPVWRAAPSRGGGPARPAVRCSQTVPTELRAERIVFSEVLSMPSHSLEVHDRVVTDSLRWFVLLKYSCLAVLLAPLLSAPARAEYALAPGDVVEVSAIGAPDLRHRATIDVDGRASLPLLGSIKVVGFTLTELREQLKSELSTKTFRARETD